MEQERGEMNAYNPLENAHEMYEAEKKNGRTVGFNITFEVHWGYGMTSKIPDCNTLEPLSMTGFFY